MGADSPPAARLDYASPARDAAVLVDERPDGGVTITIPTRRKQFGRIGRWLVGEAILLWPLVWLLHRLLASNEPRAILRLTPDEFILTERSDDGLGYVATSRSWPRRSLTEMRANRYVSGIYLRVAGKENVDLLIDLPREETEVIGAALEQAMRRLSGES